MTAVFSNDNRVFQCYRCGLKAGVFIWIFQALNADPGCEYTIIDGSCPTPEPDVATAIARRSDDLCAISRPQRDVPASSNRMTPKRCGFWVSRTGMVSGSVCRFFGQCFISPMFFSRLFIAACCVLRDSLGNSFFGLLFTNRSGNIIYFCHAFRHLSHFLSYTPQTKQAQKI